MLLTVLGFTECISFKNVFRAHRLRVVLRATATFGDTAQSLPVYISMSMPDSNLHHRGGNAKKMVIVSFLGNPMPNTDGNLVRICKVLQFLVESGFNVTFYSFVASTVWPWNEKDERDFRANFPQVSLVRDRWNVWLALVERLKNNLIALAPSFAARIAAVSVPGLTPKWSRLRADYPDAVILLNYVMNATQLNGVEVTRACIETHDLCFRELALNRRQPIWHWDILRRMRRELAILDAAALVLSISRTEHAVFETLLQTPKVCYLPPYNKPRMEPNACNAATIDLLFLGSGNYKNIRGINSFLEEYRTWKTKPTLAIAGTVSGHVNVDPITDAGVCVMGYVEDLASLYRRARATICPVEGTGVNMKLVEALAYGKPTFASAAGIAALPQGSEECVFPLTEICIQEVLYDAKKLSAAGAAALKYVDSPYIHSLWADFRQVMRDLLNGG